MKTLALFDLDNTLLSGDSDYAWGQYLIDQGVVDRQRYETQNDAFYTQYKQGSLDIHAFLAFALMAVTTTITAVLLLPVALFSGETLWPHSLHGWGVLLGIAWISHTAGQSLIAWALAHLPAAFSSVSLLLQPVLAGVFAWTLLAEPLSTLQIVGGIIVLIGIALARRASV